MAGKRAERLMRIRELSAATGVPKGTIKSYIREVLIPRPIKTHPNSAYYNDTHLSAILAVKELRKKRFLPLSVIKEIVGAGKDELSIEEIREGDYRDPAPRLSVCPQEGQNLNGLGMMIQQDDMRLGEGDFCNGAIAPDQMGNMRRFPEAAMYRTEIDALYLCSSGQHPGGGVAAAVGYNAFVVIAEDCGLERFWETNDLGY